MGLTRKFRDIVAKRAESDPAFRAALVEEAARNLLEGELDSALGQMRDVVNATMGFDALSTATNIPKTSLMRMLGPRGNPRAGNLAMILKALGTHNGIRVIVRAEPRDGSALPTAAIA
jgi:DNA-binding phage protein